MTLANLFLLGWNYEKWKYILPFNRLENAGETAGRRDIESDARIQESADRSGVFSRYGIRPLYARFRVFLKQLFGDKFPVLFFAGVFAVVLFFMLGFPRLYSLLPRNSFLKCQTQFKGGNRIKAGDDFCNCVHTNGNPLDKCLDEYETASDDTNLRP